VRVQVVEPISTGNRQVECDSDLAPKEIIQAVWRVHRQPSLVRMRRMVIWFSLDTIAALLKGITKLFLSVNFTR
jgi:hypothetical protein